MNSIDARSPGPEGSGSAADSVLRTTDSPAAMIARISLGAVMLPHGAQKLLGWFGGFGFADSMQFFTHTMGLPWLVAFAVIVIESFGALALLAGAAGRVFAVGTALVMGGAVFTTHLKHGFFMNWFGDQQGGGFEFHLLALGLAAVVVISVSGKWSVDGLLSTDPERAIHAGPSRGGEA